MQSLLNHLLNLIKRAIVTKPGLDDGNFAIQQISHNGKTGDCEIVFPYGMHANLPPESYVLVFSIDGNEENRAGIGGVPVERIRNLPEKEVVFFHPFTKSKIHFKNNGDIDIDSKNDVNITINGNVNLSAKNVNVTCENIDAIASSNVDITCQSATITAASKATIDAPITDVTGIMNVTGVINANGGLIAPTGALPASGPATLGSGGGSAPIARAGDPVEVVVVGGSSSGTHSGTITSGGSNTST